MRDRHRRQILNRLRHQRQRGKDENNDILEHCEPTFHAWKQACKEAGVSGLLVHDLRRCAARNLSRAGVPREVAMKITGHRTESMYRRYRIVDERDIKEATDRMQAHLEDQVKA